ncbi:MAG TPA: NAD-dependent epimerase/dehydratase family protein [Gemmatales bacterium]|nr:NAD-dependent epimerase/dehydratase family protein [Gemmatales bacterium]HMP18304.1 NAD-dependent epimerase/dehydratase family protein [Gemmatales bacterium]
MPKYLITGTTGFVGSHLAEACQKRGIPTVTIARSSSDLQYPREFGCQVVSGDLTDPQVVQQAMEGVNVVIHSAAKVGDWGPVEDYREVNVQATALLLEAAKAQQVERFIHISSLGVYEARDHFNTDETVPPPRKHMDGYTQTKMEAEAVVLGYFQTHQLPVVILRPGFVYGTRDRTVLPKLLENLRHQRVRYLGSGQQQMNTIHVENIVQAVFLAISKPEAVGEIFNLTDDEIVTKKQFLETVADAAGLPRPVKHVPIAVAKTLASVVEGFARLRKAQKAPILTQARIKFLGLNLGFSCEKIKKMLGYQPTVHFAEGMPEAVKWVLEHGK